MIYINSPVMVQKSINYSIYSVQGQITKSGVINLNSNESINISDLSAGTYEIKFYNNQSASTYKFIKQ